MSFTEKEMLEDLKKVRIREFLCLGGGIGILGLSIALFSMLFVRHDWPAVILSAIGLFWSVVLLYQFNRARQLERLIKAGMEPAGEPGPAPPDEPEAGPPADSSEDADPGRETVGTRGGARGEP